MHTKNIKIIQEKVKSQGTDEKKYLAAAWVYLLAVKLIFYLRFTLLICSTYFIAIICCWLFACFCFFH